MLRALLKRAVSAMDVDLDDGDGVQADVKKTNEGQSKKKRGPSQVVFEYYCYIWCCHIDCGGRMSD